MTSPIGASTNAQTNAQLADNQPQGWFPVDLAVIVASNITFLDCAEDGRIDLLRLGTISFNKRSEDLLNRLKQRVSAVFEAFGFLVDQESRLVDQALIQRVFGNHLDNLVRLPGHLADWEEKGFAERSVIESVSLALNSGYNELVFDIAKGFVPFPNLSNKSEREIEQETRLFKRQCSPIRHAVSLSILENVNAKTPQYFTHIASHLHMASYSIDDARDLVHEGASFQIIEQNNGKAAILRLREIFHRLPGLEGPRDIERANGLTLARFYLRNYRHGLPFAFVAFQNRFTHQPQASDLRFFLPEQAAHVDVGFQGYREPWRVDISDSPFPIDLDQAGFAFRKEYQPAPGQLWDSYVAASILFYTAPTDTSVTFRPIKYRIDFLTQAVVEMIFDAGLVLTSLDLNGALYVALMDYEGQTNDYLERLIQQGAQPDYLVPVTGEPILFDIVERLFANPAQEFPYLFLLKNHADVNKMGKGKSVLGTLKERLKPNQIQPEGFSKFLAPFVKGEARPSEQLLIDMFEMCNYLGLSNDPVIEIALQHPRLLEAITKRNPDVRNSSAKPFYAFMKSAGISCPVSEGPVTIFLRYVRQEFAKETVREKKQARLAPFFTLLQSLPSFPYNQEMFLAEARRVIEANPTIYGTIREDFFPNLTITATGAATTVAAAAK
jgi:hypothetical protein